MKSSDGFDARRLRPRGPRNWRMRLAAALAALFACFGILLAMAGTATLLGRPASLGALNDSPVAAVVLVALGVLLLWIGIIGWRLFRRRMRRTSDLNMAPHLMKKRN
ncbi:hypothetical protein ACX0MV_10345 [Pseudomonas borbori]